MSKITPSLGVVEKRRLWISRTVFILNAAIQAFIAGIGLLFINAEDEFSGLEWLAIWCSLGTLYAIVAIAVVGRSSRSAADADGRPSDIQLSKLARALTYVFTVLTSLVGLSAAIQVLVFRFDPDFGFFFNFVGVWAMILAWGFLHWNFAQLYQQSYYASAEPTLRFPNKPHPGIADFAYFSYTIGTSFAASDVEVRSTRARWGLVWHSIISFFFNSLIIVLAMNIITSIDLSGQ